MARFVSDSSADMLHFKGVDFVSVPLSISTTERTFTDDALLDVMDMVDYMEGYKERSFTACPGTQAWIDAFEGADVIYVTTLSSGISGTYNAAMTAKDIYLEDHPEAKIHVFDSLTTGPELRLLIEKLVELDAQGLPFDEVVAQGEDYKNKTRIYFAFKSLHNLAQNGRISKVVAAAVGALDIRIVGTGSPEGTLAPIAKRKGDRRAAAELFHQLEEIGFTSGKIRICHTDAKELALNYAQTLRNKYPDTDIKIYESRGLIAYYAERGGVIIAVENANPSLPEDGEENEN